MNTYTLKVLEMGRDSDLANNKEILVAKFQILDSEGGVVSEQKHAFDIEKTSDEITTELQAVVNAFATDEDAKARNEEVENINNQAQETIEEVSGIELQSNGETNESDSE